MTTHRELVEVFEAQDRKAMERKRALLASAKSQVLWLASIRADNQNGKGK